MTSRFQLLELAIFPPIHLGVAQYNAMHDNYAKAWPISQTNHLVGHPNKKSRLFIGDEIVKLHELPPREQSGRDTFSRYRAQVRAASIAALKILRGESIDKVYCDFHDDFVVRSVIDGVTVYQFVQVKTKGKQNENWTLNEVCGIKTRTADSSKQDSKVIKDSFVGKLLSHTVAFQESCDKVIFMTNVHLDDRMEEFAASISSGDFENTYVKLILDRFDSCFFDDKGLCDEEKAKSHITKLEFESDVQYIKDKNNNFEPIARHEIYHFSEIDLEPSESKQILINLLELVQRKSSGVIRGLTEESIDKLAGVGIDDLLEVLSISKDAYHILASGGDGKAVKSASVIQRALQSAGADADEIKFCSKCKTDWDIWLRNNRNIISEMDLMDITSRIDDVFREATRNTGSIKIHEVRPLISALHAGLQSSGKLFDLTETHIFGGFFSALVRFKS